MPIRSIDIGSESVESTFPVPTQDTMPAVWKEGMLSQIGTVVRSQETIGRSYTVTLGDEPNR